MSVTPKLQPTAVSVNSGAVTQAAILARYLSREISGEMTLMYWLKATPDVELIRSEICRACADLEGRQGAEAMAWRELASLLDANHDGCERIATMLRSGVDSDDRAANVDDGIAFCRNLFDWSVEQSSNASVALYSLGNDEILARATAEIVGKLDELGVLGLERDALEIGCGTGRFIRALSSRIRSVVGIDVSEKMILAARLACIDAANASLLQCSGKDLAPFADETFDLVLAVDSFPYLYQSGGDLVARHFREVSRVLRPAGAFVIFEYSYRGDLELDRADVGAFAARNDFLVRVSGVQSLSLWDGALFHLSKDSSSRKSEMTPISVEAPRAGG